MAKWSKTHKAEVKVTIESGVPECNKAFHDFINDDNNLRILDIETGDIINFNTGEVTGNINDEPIESE